MKTKRVGSSASTLGLGQTTRYGKLPLHSSAKELNLLLWIQRVLPSISFVLAVSLLLLATGVKAQPNPCDWLGKSPATVEPVPGGPVTYRMTADYFNRTIDGGFIDNTRVVGECTQGLPEGKERWNNCSITTSHQPDGAYPEPTPLTYIENFEFIPGYQISEASAFPGWPENSFHAKNLVWDMLAFEAFGLSHFDKLVLNTRIKPADIDGVVNLAGQGSFENRNSTVRWMGVTSLNNIPCAVLEYRQMHGKVEVEMTGFKMKGRSHYWGTIWISLLTRRMERAEMTEDVLSYIEFQDQPGIRTNTLREITVEIIK